MYTNIIVRHPHPKLYSYLVVSHFDKTIAMNRKAMPGIDVVMDKSKKMNWETWDTFYNPIEYHDLLAFLKGMRMQGHGSVDDNHDHK